MAMTAPRLVRCPDRAGLAAEVARFVHDRLAVHPGRFVALAVGDSTLPLYAALDPVDPVCAVVLGLGPDGHFAFNQPPTPVDAPARLVDLAPANLARLGPVAPARAALSIGVTTVLAAGAVLVVAAGPGKEQALEHLLTGP